MSTEIALLLLQDGVVNGAIYALLALALLALAASVLGVARLDDLSVLRTFAFWISGRWSVTALWAGLLVGCFLIFRLSEYSRDEKPIPGWAMSEAERKKHDAAAGAGARAAPRAAPRRRA